MDVLLVGLDAAAPDVLERLFEEDRVPTIESLFDSGASGPLESQLPPWTASAWPSMYTGVNPGKHGVFDFLSFDGYDWDIVNATHVRERPLWAYADDAGLTSVVVNVPVTHPAPDIDGAIVPGYLAPEEPACHPEGILDDVRDEIGEYRVYATRETDERVDDELRYEEYRRLSEQRGAAFRYLADRFDPEFGFLQFQKTDAVFHDFPGEFDRVRGVYEAVDQALERVIDECDPDTVVVASDHGIGPYDGYECRVNEHLRRSDVVEATTDGEGVPSWFRIKDERLTEGGDGADSKGGAVERLAGMAARFGLTYQRGKAILERLGLATFVGRHVSVGTVFAASERVDFGRSTAYLRSPSELGVRLNVLGREPDGVVEPDEYEGVRDAVVAVLEDVEAPTGEPVFESVLPREAVFDGPYADEGVDIVCVPRDFEHSLSALLGDPFGDPEPYNHKPTGVVALHGDDVDSDAELADAHLFDVAPTVLSALGLAPGEHMDGTTLQPVEEVDPVTYPAYEPSSMRGTNDEDVEQRLADLGYLE